MHTRTCCHCGTPIPPEKLRRGIRGAFFCCYEHRIADRQAFREAKKLRKLSTAKKAKTVAVSASKPHEEVLERVIPTAQLG